MKHLFTYNRIAVLMLVVYCGLQSFCISKLSVGYDEGLFSSYGASILKFKKEKDILLYESKLPITALNMIPRAVEQVINPGLTKTYDAAQADIINGRYVSLLASVFLGWLIFWWSGKLYGPRTGLFSLLFYLLCPNFLAHGIFVSSDIFACLFMTLSIYFLWRFYLERKNRFFLLMAVATGMAEISKFSMVHLFILIPLLLLVFRVGSKQEPGVLQFFSPKKILAYAAVFLFINWLLISCAHFFYQVFQPLNHYAFMSGPYQNLQHLLPWLPVPLPSSYISSMDAVMYFDHLGGGVKNSLNGPIYILGETSEKGFWYYYFVTLFFKVPIPVLIIWLSSILLLFRNFNKHFFFRNELFLVLPAIYFLIYMNFLYSTQVGIRHLLVIFPVLHIFSGRFISKLFELKKTFILYILVGWAVVSVGSYFPHFLPYTNEFIWNKKMAYKKLADSNLCYGEGRKFLNEYLEKNKDAIVLPEKPVAGKIVMEVNEMLNKDIKTMGKYDWVTSLTPVDHIHSQYLVFDVKQSFIDSLNKK